MSDAEDFDVVVVGAGISGIYAAKFYLDVHPECRLAILDKDQYVGGTWNSRRGYDDFWTQWTVGMAEFSDTPMPQPPDEDLYYDFFKAKHTTQYLENYTNIHSHNGQTLHDRIKFGVDVISVNKRDGKWLISAKKIGAGTLYTCSASKLMIASGLTSVPNMPVLPGKENFCGPIIHQEAFGSSKVLASADMKNITVLGGAKSSADMIYSAVKAGKTVTWVFKASDTTGPGFFLSPKGKGPYKNAFEVGMTRVAATFTPSFMNGETWRTKLLHGSTYGVKLMRSFWGAVDKETRQDADFKHRENLGGFENLSPHTSIFWQNGTGGLLNHADFFDVIARNVKIHCADILSLEKGLVRLQNGEEIPSDALFCGTGWVPSLQFFSREQLIEFGLPYLRSDEPAAVQQSWEGLEAAADQKVVSSFPLLADAPSHYHKPVTQAPYRLYKHIAPLSDIDATRSVVFIGHIGVGNYFRGVEAQSIWATAYLDKKLVLPNAEERQEEVALFRAWCRRRYLNNGEKGNWMTFELVGYTDRLLEQVGLKTHRKGWFKDLFEPCRASDFKGLKEEYLKKYEESKEGTINGGKS